MIRTVDGTRASPQVTMSVMTDPDEIARFRVHRAQADRNVAWLRAHAAEAYAHRGKYFCVCGEELFLGDTQFEAVAAAREKYPDETGYILHYVPVERTKRV